MHEISSLDQRILSILETIDQEGRSILRSSFCRHFELFDNVFCSVVYDDFDGCEVDISLCVEIESHEILACTSHRLTCVAEPLILHKYKQCQGYIPYRNITASCFVLSECEFTSGLSRDLSVVVLVVKCKSWSEVHRNLYVLQRCRELDISDFILSDVSIGFSCIMICTETYSFRIAIVCIALMLAFIEVKRLIGKVGILLPVEGSAAGSLCHFHDKLPCFRKFLACCFRGLGPVVLFELYFQFSLQSWKIFIKSLCTRRHHQD